MNYKSMTLTEFLTFIAKCNGDAAMDIISSFQCGSLEIDGCNIHDISDNEDIDQ